MTKTNKLNIFLIKEKKNTKQIFKKALEGLRNIKIGKGVLYYNPKEVTEPEWVKKFFKNNFQKDGKNIFNSAISQAIFIRKVKIKNKKITFALSFGNGFNLLNNEAIEPSFGVKIVLSAIPYNHLRKIDKHDISAIPKHTSEQLSKIGEQRDFDLNIETDILTGVVGSFKENRKSKINDLNKNDYETFGTTLTGTNSLSVNAKFDIDNVDDLLKTSYKYYISKKYLNNGFEWIDNIKIIKSKTKLYENLCNKLDEQLININDENDKIWLAVPEIVDWSNISKFCYSINTENEYDDLFINDLKTEIKNDKLSVNFLKDIKIYARNADNTTNIKEWSALQCLYAEIDYNNRKFILINTNWYEITDSFLNKITSSYKKIINKNLPINLIEAKNKYKKESDYNFSLDKSLSNSVCLDANNISYGGGKSKIELCDVFDLEHNCLIHVKKYSGSNVLSHLFSQGYVSAELLLNDQEFRNEAEKKIQEKRPDFKIKEKDNYNIIFGIIAKPEKNKLEMPFFSKVTLINIVKKIQSMKGYEVYVGIIPNVSTKKEEEDNNDNKYK